MVRFSPGLPGVSPTASAGNLRLVVSALTAETHTLFSLFIQLCVPLKIGILANSPDASQARLSR